MDADNTESAKQYAFRLVAARSRTKRQITDRLARRGIPGEAVREALKTLERTGWVDDDRYARDFIESKLRADPAGRRYFRAELRKRGIDEQTAESALEEMLPPEREHEAARSAALRAFSRYANFKGEARLRRVYGHLLRRGFPSETAGGAMAENWGFQQEDE